MTKPKTTLNLSKVPYTAMFQYFNTLCTGHDKSPDFYSMHCIRATTKVGLSSVPTVNLQVRTEETVRSMNKNR
jgi:hypothetical protein